MKHRWLYGVLLGLMLHTAGARAETVALWLFDEQAGLYPSCVLGDAATGHLPLVLGLGGQLVEGKFGRALEPSLQPNSDFPSRHLSINFGGLRKRKKADQDEEQVKSATETFDPDDPFDLSWRNAHFCALMTRGQTHLRKEVAFASPTRSRLNLGNFDWTVEFWCLPIRNAALGGVLIEMGTGPRGANDQVTRIALDASGKNWLLENRASATTCEILTDSQIFTTSDATWHHVALVYDSANQQIRHFVDGKQHSLTDACALEPLPPGELDYLSIGRDGNWQNPFPGRIDELRVSDHQVYTRDFSPPDTFSQLYRSGYARAPLRAGPAPLFGADVSPGDAIQVGSRKVLFVDDALIGETEDVEIRVNPPRLVGRVYKNFGTHLTVFQDDAGQIRLYGQGPKNSLAVIVSDDGETWKVPDLGREFHGATNVVIEDPVGLGTLFVDPNAPSDQRIKYFSGYRGRGQYIYSSPDGLRFERNETSALPFRGASQSVVFYDDQRQRYVGYHRSDMMRFPSGKTCRTFVMTETKDVMRPWPFEPVSLREHLAKASQLPIGWKVPYFVDNGPLTPPGFGIEYPQGFAPDEQLDPVGTDIYVPKCVKYPWAPDTYLAFPSVYFHYHGDGPKARRALGEPERERGSGPLETQLAVSRDGIHWHRYPRPAYVGIGKHDDMDLKKVYMAHGLARRGDEIWLFYVGSEQYHSAWTRGGKDAVFKAVQRLDGFVSADTPYTGGTLVTRPLTFIGNRLVLNIDTGAAGYAQVEVRDNAGNPIRGFELDDCVYINGDFIDKEVEWLNTGRDLGELAGTPVQLVFHMHGSKLYSMQFVD